MDSLCTNGYPLAASAITHGLLLLVTHGLLQLQKQPMVISFRAVSVHCRRIKVNQEMFGLLAILLKDGTLGSGALFCSVAFCRAANRAVASR